MPYTPETTGVPWPWNVSDGSWTWELFSALPDDGNRYEVIVGKLTVSPPPKVKHQEISTNLGWQLTTWAKHSGAGKVFTAPVAVVLSTTGSYLVPDLIFIAKDRLSIIATANVLGAPDLVVEILSPSSPRADWVDKKAAYLAAGVPHYWVIDPQGQTLTAFRLMEGEYRLEGRFEGNASFKPEGFLGLTVDLAGVWA